MSNMNELLKFDAEISGDTYLKYRQPCIYVWFRLEECLYVGMTMNGIVRPLSHNVLNVALVMLPTDTVKFFYPETKLVDEVEQIERRYIQILKPKFNKRTYEPRKPQEELSKLPTIIHTETVVAKILSSEVQKRAVLENTQSCLFGTAFCSYCRKAFVKKRQGQKACTTLCRNRNYWLKKNKFI